MFLSNLLDCSFKMRGISYRPCLRCNFFMNLGSRLESYSLRKPLNSLCMLFTLFMPFIDMTLELSSRRFCCLKMRCARKT